LAPREAAGNLYREMTGRGAFKGVALLGAFTIIVAAWWWDASLLTSAADKNLLLIKAVTRSLPLEWGSKGENALRIFDADRALLLIESVAVAKLLMARHRVPLPPALDNLNRIEPRPSDRVSAEPKVCARGNLHVAY
jgi:hypothetical protein